MKVLVCTPLHPEYGIRKRSLESILNMDYRDRLTFMFQRSEGSLNSDHYYDILAKVTEARNLALEGYFDALMLIESDIVVPKDALFKMSELSGDVIYGLYCSRKNGHPWLVFTDIELDNAKFLKKPEKATYWGSAIDSMGAGFGCTLIFRNVLRNIPFRMQPGGPSTDWWFALDCKKEGVRQITDLSVSCGHMLDDKTIVWADPTHKDFYRIDEVTE